MKNYNIILTKSYIVEVKARNESEARHLAEFYTSDIVDISTDKDKKGHDFEIEQIGCGFNETFEANEIFAD